MADQDNNTLHKPFDEKEKQRLRTYYKMWENDPRAFENNYGADVVNQLGELMRRLNAETRDNGTPEEHIATNYMAESLNEGMENPTKETDETVVNNPFKQVTHGGARGFAMLWNGIVDMGRGAIDPENHAKYLDLAFNNRFVTSNKQRRNAVEKMFERWKSDAVAGKRGFKSAWMRSVLQENEIDKYGRYLVHDERRYAQGLDEGGAWLKFDEIPYANEDLGKLGAIAEIAIQEAVTIGPLAVLKLLRANKIARHFATKAGGKIKKGEVLTEKGKRTFKSGKVQSELSGADYEDYLKTLKRMPERDQKKTKRLMDIYQTEGRYIKRVPWIGGGGAYAEAEIISSAMVVTGGVMVQGMIGRDYSVIGEVGGGIVGPRLAAKAVRYAGDWFTYINHRLPGNTQEKERKLLLSMGYTTGDIADMPIERKRKIITQATSSPSFKGVLGFGDLRSKDRRALDAYRYMEKEFSSLPDDIKDKVMERGDRMRSILDKFDKMSGGEGKIYTTIDKAMNMAWLATIREQARSRMRLGHTVTAKFNVNDMALAEKEIENAKALNTLLKELGDKKFGKTANYEMFLDGIREQLANHMARLTKDKGTIGRQAKIIQGELVNINNPSMNHIFKYIDKEGFAYDFTTGNVQRDSFRPIKKKTLKDGTVVEEMDELGLPQRTELSPEDTFNEGSAKNQALDFSDVTTRDTILNEEGAKFIDVNMGDGRIVKKLVPKYRLSQADINKNAEESLNFLNTIKKRADEAGKKAYENITGFNISPARNAINSPLNNAQLDSLIARIGESLLSIRDDVPMSVRPVINDGSKGMKDMSIQRYFTNKRFDALTRLRKNLKDDKKFIEELENITKGTPLGDRFDPEDFLDEAGEVRTNVLQEFMNRLANELDIGFAKEGVADLSLDISLSQLAKIRTSLYQNASKQIITDGQRVSGMYNYKLGKVLTDEFDNIDSLKQANEIWKSKVGRPFREGIGRLIVDNPSVSGNSLFKLFVKPKGKNYTAARQDFDEMFRMDDGTINPLAKDYLTKSVQEFVDDGGRLDRGFLRAFSDTLDIPYKSDDMVEAGTEFFKPWKDKSPQISKRLDSISGNALDKIKENKNIAEANAKLNPEFNPFGVPTEQLQNIFGREALDSTSLRRAIIQDTYEGGETARVQALAKYIRGIPNDKKRKAAQASLQKTLWDGAIEEVYRRRSTQGVGYQQEAVKFAEDGTPVGVDAGRLFENLEVDSGAMQIYIERNAKVLGDIMTETDFEHLVELSSLTTLVAGDMGRQAVENFPTQMGLKSIMSRVYGVARSVISPRYVITELLIQDARFRRGKLIQDMATDPDSFYLLTDVLFKEGFTKPRIRGEFVNKFWGTMIRYARTKNNAELQQESEEAWEKAGN